MLSASMCSYCSLMISVSITTQLGVASPAFYVGNKVLPEGRKHAPARPICVDNAVTMARFDIFIAKAAGYFPVVMFGVMPVEQGWFDFLVGLVSRLSPH